MLMMCAISYFILPVISTVCQILNTRIYIILFNGLLLDIFIRKEKGCNNFTFYDDNQQQQKAQTLSGWSNFVGKQTLFDQLNKLKKNMYSANNGRQHQSNKFHTYNKNSSNDNYQEYQDNQVSGYISRAKDLKSEKESAKCVESNDLENRTRSEITSLPHMGTL